jgi:hypothetical protein
VLACNGTLHTNRVRFYSPTVLESSKETPAAQARRRAVARRGISPTSSMTRIDRRP